MQVRCKTLKPAHGFPVTVRPDCDIMRAVAYILVAGVQRLGESQWATIRKAHAALFESTGRTDVDLKDKWRNLKRAMRRDGTVPGLSAEHVATLRAAIAEEDRKAAGGE